MRYAGGMHETTGGAAMRAFTITAARVLVVAAALSLGACAQLFQGVDDATHDTGATPGTVPGHIGAPNAPMDNGLMPEPWGDTS